MVDKKTQEDAFQKIIDWIKSSDFEQEKLPLKIAEACNNKQEYQNFLTYLLKISNLAGKAERDKLKLAQNIANKKIKELKKQAENNATPQEQKKVTTLSSGKKDEETDKQQSEETKNTSVALPKIVNDFETAFRERKIVALPHNKDQKEFPFGYDLYKPGITPSRDDQPTGNVTIESENLVTLTSDDLQHFIATVMAIKNSGSDKIELSLDNGNEEEKKAFAANAIIAGALVGIKVENSPYSLEELKDVNAMVGHVINLQQKQQEIASLAEKQNHKPEDLEAKITDTFDYYEKFSKDLIPPKEQLKIFECGIRAAQQDKIRNAALNVLRQKKANSK